MDVEPSAPGSATFGDLVGEISSWIRMKEGPQAVRGPWLEHSGEWLKPNGRASVTVDSLRAVDAAGPDIWAMRYHHQDAEFTARSWTIDFGVTKTADERWRLAVSVGHALRDNYLGKEPGRLPVTPPKVVKELVSSGRWRCKSGSTVLAASPFHLEVGNGHALRNAIADRQRGCPVIYVSRERISGDTLVDAGALAKALVGTAIVYEAASSDIDDELEWIIPREFRCPNGQVRVYAPMADLDDRSQSYRHRFYTRQQIESEGAAVVEEQIASSLARRAGWARIASSVTSIDDVAARKRELRRAELQSSANDTDRAELLELSDLRIRDLLAEVDRLNRVANSAQEAWEEEADKCAAAENDLAKVRFERESARSEADELRKRNKALELASRVGLDFKTLPKTVADVVELAERLHGTRVVFTDDAKKSARAAGLDNASDGAEIAWECIYAAAVVLPRLAFDEGVSSGLLPARFKEATTFDMAMTEGKQTKNESRLTELRKTMHGGREWDVSAHIKYGTKAPRCLRIHFALDNEGKRVVIGHCGDHLETAGTRRRGH